MSDTENTSSEKPYMKNIRQIQSQVYFTFYNNSENNPANVSITGETLDAWQESIKNQILAEGFKPAYKYATLDGYSFPDGTVYPLNQTLGTIFPLWNNSICGADAKFSIPPEYVLTFSERKTERIYIVGEEMWGQGPIEYTVKIYVPATYTTLENNLEPDYTSNEYTVIQAISPTTSIETLDNVNFNVYSFKINCNEKFVKQALILNKNYPSVCIKLIINKWSAPNTTAKIMHFSNALDFICGTSDIQSLSLIEDKAADVEKLSYDLTSNSCTVKIKNKNNRFIRNRTLLQKNRIFIPLMKEKSESDWYKIGKFYCDEWTVPSDSAFITCKGYDSMYALQNQYINYPMEQDLETGVFSVDGSVNGHNADAKSVFEKIFNIINEDRNQKGVFGTEVEYYIDPKLTNITFDYVTLGYDTAWNMLGKLANATQSFIYVARGTKTVSANNTETMLDFAGRIMVMRDKFADEGEDSVSADISINPSNSYTYNLPIMNQAIANRINIPYVEFAQTEEQSQDERFTIKQEDLTLDENGNKIATLELKHFYPKIKAIYKCSSSDFTDIDRNDVSNQCNILYDKIIIVCQNYDDDNLFFKIEINNSVIFDILNKTYTLNKSNSQTVNGIVEFTSDCGNLLNAASAEKAAEKIAAKYGGGKCCVETTWKGTPELYLGKNVNCSSRFDFDASDNENTILKGLNCECISNEFTFDGGLKVKTKAREN